MRSVCRSHWVEYAVWELGGRLERVAIAISTNGDKVCNETTSEGPWGAQVSLIRGEGRVCRKFVDDCYRNFVEGPIIGVATRSKLSFPLLISAKSLHSTSSLIADILKATEFSSLSTGQAPSRGISSAIPVCLIKKPLRLIV